MEAIRNSDGLSSFERANYPYVFKKLSEDSRNVISGLLGGELLGPVNMLSDYINYYYFSLFYRGRDISWKEELERKPYNVNPDIIEFCSEELTARIESKKNQITSLKNGDKGFLYYYYDLLNLGYRRFYGAEVHIERYYAENLTPFLDYDLLDYLLSTDYVNIYKGSYSKNPFRRRNSKIVQATAICKNYPPLGDIVIDRNFMPGELFSFIPRLLIPLKFYYRKFNRINSNPDFKQKTWDKIFYSSFENRNSGIFRFYENMQGKELNIAASLNIWISSFN
jgi:hypothetical protein